MIYIPVQHVQTGTWMLGKNDEHRAYPLSKEEIEKVCEKLNKLNEKVEKQ
jgi:hypothetical protein